MPSLPITAECGRGRLHVPAGGGGAQPGRGCSAARHPDSWAAGPGLLPALALLRHRGVVVRLGAGLARCLASKGTLGLEILLGSPITRLLNVSPLCDAVWHRSAHSICHETDDRAPRQPDDPGALHKIAAPFLTLDHAQPPSLSQMLVSRGWLKLVLWQDMPIPDKGTPYAHQVGYELFLTPCDETT